MITSLASFLSIISQEVTHFWCILTELFNTHLIGELVVCNELDCNCRYGVVYRIYVIVRLICDIQIILSGIKFNSKKIFRNFTTSWLVKTIRGLEKGKKYNSRSSWRFYIDLK